MNTVNQLGQATLKLQPRGTSLAERATAAVSNLGLDAVTLGNRTEGAGGAVIGGLAGLGGGLAADYGMYSWVHGVIQSAAPGQPLAGALGALGGAALVYYVGIPLTIVTTIIGAAVGGVVGG